MKISGNIAERMLSLQMWR